MKKYSLVTETAIGFFAIAGVLVVCIYLMGLYYYDPSAAKVETTSIVEAGQLLGNLLMTALFSAGAISGLRWLLRDIKSNKQSNLA